MKTVKKNPYLTQGPFGGYYNNNNNNNNNKNWWK